MSKVRFCLYFIIIPLSLGGLYYLIFREWNIFSQFHSVLDSLPSVLWSFSFTVFMILLWDFKINLFSIPWFFIAVFSGGIWELLQLWNPVLGTADVYDAVWSTIISVAFFIIVFLRGENEKI